jgi:hypothetical protein
MVESSVQIRLRGSGLLDGRFFDRFQLLDRLQLLDGRHRFYGCRFTGRFLLGGLLGGRSGQCIEGAFQLIGFSQELRCDRGGFSRSHRRL